MSAPKLRVTCTYVQEFEVVDEAYPDDVNTLEQKAEYERTSIFDDDTWFLEGAEVVDVKVEVLP